MRLFIWKTNAVLVLKHSISIVIRLGEGQLRISPFFVRRSGFEYYLAKLDAVHFYIHLFCLNPLAGVFSNKQQSI